VARPWSPAANQRGAGAASGLWWLIWVVPGILFASALYELALALWANPNGVQPGESYDGSDIATAIAWVTMLVGLFVAIAHAVRPGMRAAVALFAPAATAFAVAQFFTYDPYYFPTLRRYSEGRPGAGAFIAVMVALSLIVATWTYRRPRSGSAATALLLPWLLFGAGLLTDGH
jgi:hypothetical protein